MKCQALSSEIKKKNITHLSSANSAQIILTVIILKYSDTGLDIRRGLQINIFLNPCHVE